MSPQILTLLLQVLYSFAGIYQSAGKLEVFNASSWLLGLIIAFGTIYFVLYVIKAIAIYLMAKRQGIKNKWFAFVPFLNFVIIGELTGRMKVFNVDVKNLGIFVAIFSVVYMGCGIASEVLEYGASFVDILNTGVLPQAIPQPPLTAAIAVFSALDLVVGFLYIIAYIFLILAFFRLYEKKHPILYGIIGAIFSPLLGFFILAVRKNDKYDYYAEMRRRYQNMYGANPNAAGGGTGGASYQKPSVPDPFAEYSDNSEKSDESSLKQDIFTEFSEKPKASSDNKTPDEKTNEDERRFGLDGSFGNNKDNNDKGEDKK